MDLTGLELGDACPQTMSVPSTSGRRELRISTGMFFSMAGSTVAGCSTFAPKYASSAASAKEHASMRWPPGRIVGSAGQHAVDVGPDLDLFRADARADDGRREIRPAAAERGGDAVFGARR